MRSPQLTHHLWLERPRFLAMVRRRWLVTIGSIVVYASGLAGAATFSTAHPYLKSPAFVLGSIGIAWVFASIRRRARIVDILYADLFDIYSIDIRSYCDHVKHHFDATCKVLPQLCVSAVFACISVVAAWLSFYQYPISVGMNVQGSLRPWLFDSSVYINSSRDVYFFIVSGFGVLISMMVGIGVWLLLRELVLVRSMAGLPVVPLANSVRARIKPLADFHVRVAMDWSIGALLFFALFFQTPDLISVVLISFLLIIAVIVLILPQIHMAKIVRRAHERACGLALLNYHDVARENAQGDLGVDYLADLTTVTERPPLWVYSVDELLRWAAAQLIAVAALYSQISNLQ